MGTSPVQRLGNALRTRGPWQTVRTFGKRLHREFFPAPVPTHPFDLEHGVDTSGLLFADQLASGHPNDDHINAYWGTPPSGFRGILDYWQDALAGTPYRVQDYTFLDIGCGKGRVLMMASETPFQRIVGVELSPPLTAIAQTNMARWSAEPPAWCSNIDVLNVDALAAPIPDSPVVLYIYNSFNLYVMLPLLERLRTLALTRSTHRPDLRQAAAGPLDGRRARHHVPHRWQHPADAWGLRRLCLRHHPPGLPHLPLRPCRPAAVASSHPSHGRDPTHPEGSSFCTRCRISVVVFLSRTQSRTMTVPAPTPN